MRKAQKWLDTSVTGTYNGSLCNFFPHSRIKVNIPLLPRYNDLLIAFKSRMLYLYRYARNQVLFSSKEGESAKILLNYLYILE